MRASRLMFAVSIAFAPIDAEAKMSADEMRPYVLLLIEYADSICVPKGNRTDIEVNADIKAGLKSLLGKLIEINPSISSKYKSEKYEGIIQEHITGEVTTPAECKKDAVRMMKEDIFSEMKK